MASLITLTGELAGLTSWVIPIRSSERLSVFAAPLDSNLGWILDPLCGEHLFNLAAEGLAP
jgi:hypothetical protein